MVAKWIDQFVSDGTISRDQLREAEVLAHRLRISTDDALVQLDYMDEIRLGRAKAEAFGLEFVDLDKIEISESVRKLIPEKIARDYVCIAIGSFDQTLKVAVVHPLNFDQMDKLHHVLNRNITPVIAIREQILSVIDRCYSSGKSDFSDHLLVHFWETNIWFVDAEPKADQSSTSGSES